MAVANKTHYEFYDYIDFMKTPDEITVNYKHQSHADNGAFFAYRFKDANNTEYSFDFTDNATSSTYKTKTQTLTLDGKPIVAEVLDELGVSYDVRIISAHREPDVFFEYAKGAEAAGMKVIIAGAGMAAHLPGMCAALFPLPVIGVPMHTSSLGGRDSLYSIVQMPGGIPVATVAIGGAKNAGILAAKMLAISDEALLARLKAYSEKMLEEVQKKDARLQEVGCMNY